MEQEDTQGLIRQLSQPLYQAKGWMKLVGVLMIIYGVLTALSIIGIIVAWLPIWMGVLLMQTANAAEEAQMTGDEATLERALTRLKTYFIIMGVVALIGLILMVLGMIGGIAGGLMGLGGMGGIGHMGPGGPGTM